MKKVKLAIAIAAATFLSSSVYAQGTESGDNTVTVNVAVTAYIAAGLNVSYTGLHFGDVVRPADTDSETNDISINCNEIVYSAGASPSGPNNVTQNEGGAKSVESPSKGEITITGEDAYAVSVAVTSINPIKGVVFTPLISNVDPTCTQLGENIEGSLVDGELKLNLLGTLAVSNLADEEAVTTTAVVTINYR